ncbi:PaREP1 family protein [Hyperthermus butylicus]|uniref:PaREP1 family protein n=1 Tax=Hyperthermus butylicus TaxID=54248 RepID=UPI00064E6952|nr:PaREP1 family protein [Hyperthermus butylicus]
MAAVAVSLEELFPRFRTAARLAERVHQEDLMLFTEEAHRLLLQGDVRDATEKAWAAYKSLVGLIICKVAS